MLKIKKIIVSLFVACTIFSPITAKAVKILSQYTFNSASVLPTCIHHGAKYAILSREAFGKASGTYDDFGGSRDKGENHPIITAAREFFEEAIIALTLGWTLTDVEHYIDTKTISNTTQVIAYAQNVTYITNFNRYKRLLLNNFYNSRKRTTDRHSREKDRIALVKLNTLKKTITRTQHDSHVTIEALEVDPTTLLFIKKTVELRPFFVKKLKPFFMNKPYKQGLSKKIRLYD